LSCGACHERDDKQCRDALSLGIVPYENTTLPGYLYRADNSGKSRPLLIVQTGFDGCQEELHPYAMEGIERGYNVLTFKGPGKNGDTAPLSGVSRAYYRRTRYPAAVRIVMKASSHSMPQSPSSVGCTRSQSWPSSSVSGMSAV